MSWLFSQALVGEYWEATSSDGEQSAQLSVMPTPHKFWRNDKTMDACDHSRFGLTCAVLTESRGEELLTWYLEGFRARTLAVQEEVKASAEKDQACGSTWRESLAKFDRDSHLWKTAQCSLLEGWTLFSGTWPRSGTMLHGVAYQHHNSEPTISATEFGSLLPTPTCHNAKEGAYPAEYTRKTPTLATHVGGKIHPNFTEWMMGWPQGWTDLKPLGMDKFQQWQQAHSFN